MTTEAKGQIREQMLKKYYVYLQSKNSTCMIRRAGRPEYKEFATFSSLLNFLLKNNITEEQLIFYTFEDQELYEELKQNYTLKTCVVCAKQEYILKEHDNKEYYCSKCRKIHDAVSRSVEQATAEAIEDYEELAEKILGDDAVTLQGFLLNVSMPSEARLTQRLSAKQLKELEKLASNARVSDVSFSFFSSEYSSRIKAIRRELYTKIIAKYAIKIQHIDNKTLYLVPSKNVPSFISELEKLNKELEELKRDIEEEQERLNNNEKLQAILKEYDIKIKQVDLSGFRIYYQLDPVKLDAGSIREVLAEETNQQLTLAGEKIIEQYEKQLRERNEAILSSLEQEFISKLKILLTKLGRKISGEKVHTKVLDAELKILEDKSRSVGLKHLSELTKTTRTFLQHISENKQSSLRACAQEISQLVRIPKAEDPKVTIRHGLNKLNNIADARILSLQRKLEEMS